MNSRKFSILNLLCIHLVSALLLVSPFNSALAQKVNTTLTYSVNLPGKISNKTPVLILLHGYGSNESDLFGLSAAIGPKFITFSLRAPNNTKDGGYCWYNLEFLSNGQFKYDYNKAKESAKKISSFISNACKVYQVDSTQVFLLGFSQGAIMSYELAFSNPKKIKGIMPLSGRLMKETKELKIDWANASKVKFFIGHGTSDNVINVEESEKVNSFLKENKVNDLTFKKYPIQHTISTD